MQGNWVVEIGWQMPRIQVAGNVCLSRPWPTQGCRADDGDSDEDEDEDEDDDDDNDLEVIC
jgi:hypothetical protein